MYRRTPLAIELPKVMKLLMYTLLGLLLSTSAYFFVKASNTAEKGYSLRENQLLQKSLEAENRILKQRVLDAQSLYGLKTSDVVSEMIEPEKPVVIAPKGPVSKKS